ncbi:Subtilisin-like protein [Coniochaeta hoffmannii]|uniref:Subtilisin-like protein n=1 Tax=Coniochaeta hoffmannii TaxID=91930 RepID=A0AA38RMW9_9PEZI|nr:Subtilisin-like protein [Coniochaeta hoffmannii]
MDSIKFIEPTFPTPLGQKKTRSSLVHLQHKGEATASWNGTKVDCHKYVTPECLRMLYSIPFQGTGRHTNSSLGIFEISAQTWFPNDLDSFFSRFEPQLIGSRPTVRSIDGGYMQYNWTGFPFNSEPSLDFEYALALTDRQPVIELLVGNNSTTSPLGNMLAALDASYCNSQAGGDNGTIECGASAPPSVISISYGMSEADYPAGYLDQQCLEFLKLGLQGVSVVAGSGDWGVADQLSQCIDPATGLPADPGSGDSSSLWHFSSMFPASCPWVTAVGGTSLAAPLPNMTQPVWNQSAPFFPPQHAYLVPGDDGDRGNSTSGGGFSNVFAAPDYQTRDAASYLATQRSHIAPFANSFRADGRGYPDVALLAQNYLVVYNGGLYTIDGTSAATPLFASMVARINNERQNQGKKTVGFVNPVLYKHREIFDDVTEGANEGCGVEEAFRAAKGWDAVTGLGAPNFKRLSDVFMGLP